MVPRPGVAGFAVGPDASYPVSATPQPGSWSAAGYPGTGDLGGEAGDSSWHSCWRWGSGVAGSAATLAPAFVDAQPRPGSVRASGGDRTMLWADTIGCARSRQPSFILASPAGREPVSCGLGTKRHAATSAGCVCRCVHPGATPCNLAVATKDVLWTSRRGPAGSRPPTSGTAGCSGADQRRLEPMDVWLWAGPGIIPPTPENRRVRPRSTPASTTW